MSETQGSEFVAIISWVAAAAMVIAMLTLAGVYGCASSEWNGGTWSQPANHVASAR
jgi:hypothetical protein